MQKLHNYAKSTGGSAPSTSSTPAGRTQGSTDTIGSQGTADVDGAGEGADQTVAKDIADKLNSKPEQVAKVMTGLDSAGYKVVKK